MQLWTMLVFAPVNHLKKGAFESSSTLSQGWNHSSSAARSAQKPTGSAAAAARSASVSSAEPKLGSG